MTRPLAYYWILFLILTVGILPSCDPFNAKIENSKDEITEYQAGQIQEFNVPDSLFIMNWNIRFGGARIEFYWDCYGERTLMTEDEVNINMQGIVEYINSEQPDVLFIQEIDQGSKRSAYIDQIQWILNATEMNYAVYAPNWKADFVPSDGHGRVNTGIAIFSKWKLENPRRVALPLIDEQSAITKYFYLRRNFLECNINPNGTKMLTLFNIHASAWAQDDTKERQLEIFKTAMDSINDMGETFIAAGDFNIVPPGSITLTNFDDALDCDPDFPPDDYTGQTDWMLPFYNAYQAAIPLDVYKTNNDIYFSYTGDKDGFWTRKLDYFFTNDQFGSPKVHQNGNTNLETMPLSDHAPMSVKMNY